MSISRTGERRSPSSRIDQLGRLSFPNLGQRLFNVPLALHPAKAEIVMGAMAARFGIGHLLRGGAPVALALEPANPEFRPPAKSGRPYEIVSNVAIIPVHGLLVQKLGLLRPWSGMTGYDGIRISFLHALSDAGIKAVVLDIDSPGGEIAGLFDLTDMIREARGRKPVWAILSENAFSAAYCVASAADKITVPRTGGTGSIGVIALLTDISKALSDAGITVNIVQFGARKADGYPEIPLAPRARARFQADIDTIGNLFVNTVARNRGLKPKAVLAQQATTFQGSAGIKHGLADLVAAPDEAFRSLISQLQAPLRKAKQKWLTNR